MLIPILYIILLVLLSAIFSGTETAYTSLTFLQEKELLERGRSGKLAAKLAKKPNILLSTILIGNNLVNIAASAITTATVIRVYGNFAVGIATGILTLVILIFSEITPKHIAIVHNEIICMVMAYPLRGLMTIMFPIVFVINRVSSLITRLFAGNSNYSISEAGILHAMAEARKQGSVEDYESTFVQNVFRFDDIDVHTIMTHRTDVFSVNESLSLKEVMPLIIQSGFARVPVYGESQEHITGILLTRELLSYATNGGSEKKISEIMKEPIFVPESRKVHEMFAAFKDQKLHMAIVLDEYGGLAGVVTMEDVIEELFGELYDEHESGLQERILDLSNGSYRIVGETSIQQMEDIFDIEVQHSRHVGTVAGYIAEELGTIPVFNQQVVTDIGTFVIRKMRGNRIEVVVYTPSPKEEDEETE